MSLFVSPFTRAPDSSNDPMNGAKLYFYLTGTLTAASVYTTSARDVAHGPPAGVVTADAAGLFAPIYLDPGVTYRVILKTSGGSTIQDIDPYNDNASGSINVRTYGAVGDLTAPDTGTNDYAAFDGARDAGGADGGKISVPDGHYRISQKITFTEGVTLTGDGFRENSGAVDGVSYTYPMYYGGSVLVFDTGVGGLHLLDITAETDVDTVVADLPGHQDFWSARHSIVERMAILSSGDSAAAAGKYGIETNTRCHLGYLFVGGFGDDGVRISATSDVGDGVSSYGNASHSSLTHIKSLQNAGDGFDIRGRDASVISIINCDALQNDGYGYNDISALGNNYFGNQSATNTLGSYRATSAVGAHVYIGCYIETGTGSATDLTSACTVIGGNMGADAFHPQASPVFAMTGGLSVRAPYWQFNQYGSVDVAATLGYTEGQVAFAFGADTGSNSITAALATKLRLGISGSGLTEHWWGFEFGNSASATFMQFPSERLGSRPRAEAPAFPNGILLGAAGAGPRVHYGAVAAVTYAQGDMLWASAPSSGGSMGQTCTTAGVGLSTAVFKAMPNLA